MATQLVEYETRYPAAVITLNCPQTRNALSSAMIDAIMTALRRAEDDSHVRALIVTGAGPAFSVGMDLTELRRALDEAKFDHSGGASRDKAFRSEELVDRLYRFPKPTIAAVNGVAAAAGAALVSALLGRRARLPLLHQLVQPRPHPLQYRPRALPTAISTGSELSRYFFTVNRLMASSRATRRVLCPSTRICGSIDDQLRVAIRLESPSS